MGGGPPWNGGPAGAYIPGTGLVAGRPPGLAPHPSHGIGLSGIGMGRPAAASAASQQPDHDPLRVRLLLHAAASLQRLAFRRGGSLHHAAPEHCAVLLHCEAGSEANVAVLLAGWLHWYGRLPLQEASLAAEVAFQTAVDQVCNDATSAVQQPFNAADA